MMILIVDDSLDTCRALKRLLERSGYESQCVESASEAVASLRAVRPKVIVLDDMMPIRTGVELLRDLKADPDLAAIPVVMYSARADPDRIDQAMQLGAAEWLIKGQTDWTKLIGKLGYLHDLAV